jgi:hypothetical protein
MNRENKAQLIADLLKWAHAARDAKAPKTADTKVLREAIHFIWERNAGKGKRDAADMCPQKSGIEQ